MTIRRKSGAADKLPKIQQLHWVRLMRILRDEPLSFCLIVIIVGVPTDVFGRILFRCHGSGASGTPEMSRYNVSTRPESCENHNESCCGRAKSAETPSIAVIQGHRHRKKADRGFDMINVPHAFEVATEVDGTAADFAGKLILPEC